MFVTIISKVTYRASFNFTYKMWVIPHYRLQGSNETTLKFLESVNPTSNSSCSQADSAGAALLSLYSADGRANSLL